MGSLEEDWEAGCDFISRYFAGGKEKWFLRGNHDERLWLLAGSAKGLARDYAQDGIRRVAQLMHKHGAKVKPYDSAAGVLDVGKLRVLHGYHVGVTACRQHANVYGNCLFGHVHSIESASVPNLVQSEARSIGLDQVWYGGGLDAVDVAKQAVAVDVGVLAAGRHSNMVAMKHP